MEVPKLSVVIPTKDRYFYLKHLLSALFKAFPKGDVEIVIQDNSSDNTEFKGYIDSLTYPRLKYDYTSDPLPIIINSDKAIMNSTGKYVCFIGDDDGVLPSIANCVDWMEENDEEIVLPTTVFYSWPDAKGNYKKGLDLSGKVRYKKFTGKLNKKSTKEELNLLMRRGCIDRGNIPLLYHGIVKRSTLDKIYSICGTYFPGPSPDIANGVALCIVADSFVTVDMPIVIAGASKHHGGGIKKMKNRAADIDDVPFLPKNAKQNWEKRIPPIWTGETVWCESAVKAMRAMGRPDLAENVDYEKLYAQFAAFHYPLRKLAFHLTSNKVQLYINIYCRIIKRYVNALFRVFGFDNAIIAGELASIEAVIEYLNMYKFDFEKSNYE